MKKILFYLFPISILFAACATNKTIIVCDKETGAPIPKAFVYLNKFAMFYPFNSSAIYLTDDKGIVELNEEISQGQASLYAGKQGYLLNAYSGDIESNAKIKIIVEKEPTPRIKQLLIRENLIKQYNDNLLLRDFYEYCIKQKIVFFKIPGWEQVTIKNNQIELTKNHTNKTIRLL